MRVRGLAGAGGVDRSRGAGTGGGVAIATLGGARRAAAAAAVALALGGLSRAGLGRALLLLRLHRSGAYVRGALADELGDRSGLGGDLLERSGDARLAQKVGDVTALRGDRHGDHGAGGAGAGGAARAVQVRLVLHGRVDVDDELHLVDVHAARRDVGRDQHAHAAFGGIGAEGGEVALAGRLRQVAVQIHRRDAGCREHLRELLGLVLGAGEEDAAAAAGGEMLDQVGLLIVAHEEDAVRHLALRDALVVDLVPNLVAEELADQAIDAAVERGAEQHALSALRRGSQNAGHAGQEAQVGHVVGFIENRDLDAVEAHDALLHEVFEPAGAGHDDVHAVAQRGLLRLLAHTAEDSGDSEAGGRSERLDRRGDLRREFAGRCQHQTTWPARGAARCERAGQACHQRQSERDGLAAAGAAAAEHVFACKGVGKRIGLDREGFGLALTGEDVGQRRGHAEFEKSRHRDAFGMARREMGAERATARVRASVRRMK